MPWLSENERNRALGVLMGVEPNKTLQQRLAAVY